MSLREKLFGKFFGKDKETPSEAPVAASAQESEYPAFPLRVLRVVEETADARTLVFDVEPQHRTAFAYKAGQFITLHVTVGNENLRRSYSFSSSPDVDSQWAVTVKRVPNGRVSGWVHDHVTAGMTLRAETPQGRFVLSSGQGNLPLVLVGAGSGITPLFSLLKSALRTSSRKIFLLYANRDEASVIFAKELAELSKAHPDRLEVHHHLDEGKGFLTKERMMALLEPHADGAVYLCGPTPFLDLAEQALTALSVPSERRHVERFTAAAKPATATAPVRGGTPKAGVATVKVNGATHSLSFAAGQTLLGAAHRAKLVVPFSCEEGYCGCCRARLSGGKVTMACRDALTDAELEQGWILPCQAKVVEGENPVVDFDADTGG